MVSTTSITTTPLASFGTCFNNAPVKATVPTMPSAALTAALHPVSPPTPPEHLLESVSLFGATPHNTSELRALKPAPTSAAAGPAGPCTDALDSEDCFKRDTEYFKALLAARQELVQKYANTLKSLRSLRVRNSAVRKRANLKARKARAAAAQAAAMASDSQGSTVTTPSVATGGSVGSVGVVGGWHDDCREAIQGGAICASPVSMEDEEMGKYNMGGYTKEGMHYSA